MGRDARECAKASLPIYLKINILFNEGEIAPYDDYLIEFLATHKNKDIYLDNYLDSLNSTASIGNCYDYARYLALGMKGKFDVIEGNLSALHGGYFAHCWIETDKYVYDVAFSGKWPKKQYYDLFKPIDKKKIDLSTDEKYNNYLKNNIKAKTKSKDPFLRHIGWYGYTRNRLEGWPMDSPCFSYFPQDEERVAKIDEERKREKRIENIKDYWNKAIRLRDENVSSHPSSNWTSDSDDNIEIPSELLDETLYNEVDDNLMNELCVFISLNRKMYDEYKNIKHDIELWHKAIEGHYSGKLCAFFDDLPFLLEIINSNNKTERGKGK